MTLSQATVTLLASGAISVFPGYALIVVLRPQWRLSLLETVCAATGLSLAVIPLCLYITTLVGLPLSPVAVALFLAVAAGLTLTDWLPRLSRLLRKRSWQPDPVTWLLGLVFVLSLFARLWMVRGLDFPLWTDSYHHTVITQLIADAGTIPSGYEPYAPVDRFTYHFGFHAVAAWFHWLSGEEVPRSVVLAGQVINALVVPVTYLLARILSKSRVAGLVAALVVGLLAHVPVWYLNWGRYTQLAGLMLLPVLMVFAVEATRRDGPSTRLWFLTGVGAAGLFLVHIRVFVFFAVFAALLVLFRLIAALREKGRDQVRALLQGSALLVGVAVLLCLPWIVRFFGGFGSKVAEGLAGGYQAQEYGAYFGWRMQDLVDSGMRPWLLTLAIVGGVWALVKRQAHLSLLITWLLALFASANLHLVGVPPLFSNLVVIISIYLPGGVLVGYLFSELASWVSRQPAGTRLVGFARWAAIVGSLVLASLGTHQTVRQIHTESQFVRPADLEAMHWIEANLPTGVLIHISPHFWTPTVVHGLDAGYWIPYLAQRQTTIPLQLYVSDADGAYIDGINQRARALLEASADAETLWRTLTNYGVSHVYVGSRQTGLRADLLLDAPSRFYPVYSSRGVWIFEVIPP